MVRCELDVQLTPSPITPIYSGDIHINDNGRSSYNNHDQWLLFSAIAANYSIKVIWLRHSKALLFLGTSTSDKSFLYPYPLNFNETSQRLCLITSDSGIFGVVNVAVRYVRSAADERYPARGR